jgi:hypothetical protein
MVSGTGKLVGKNSISVIEFSILTRHNFFVIKDRLKNLLPETITAYCKKYQTPKV